MIPLSALIGSSCTFAQTSRSDQDHAEPVRSQLVIDAKTNTTVSSLRVANPHGDCVIVRNARAVRIEHLQIGPCGRHGINISSSKGVVVTTSYVHDTTGNGINLYDSHDIEISKNRIHRNAGGVYVQQSVSIRVDRNTFLNVKGPQPRGQFVQFNKVSGGGNRVFCNTGNNVAGQSAPEDAINMFASHGLPTDPIVIAGNIIRGGGPSKFGGGILLGDGGGSWQAARHNILIDPGQYGIAVAGGQHMEISSNRIKGTQQPFTNVGVYVWNQYEGKCSVINVRSNLVNWRNSKGDSNPRWSAGNCGTITGWEDNAWDWKVESNVDLSSNRVLTCGN